jgi:alpha-amylase
MISPPDLGFNAIWISPVPDNYPNAFHGYAAKNMEKINNFFGGEQALHDLVSACHARGTNSLAFPAFSRPKLSILIFPIFTFYCSDIWVMVDVVANHMGNTDTNYS